MPLPVPGLDPHPFARWEEVGMTHPTAKRVIFLSETRAAYWEREGVAWPEYRAPCTSWCDVEEQGKGQNKKTQALLSFGGGQLHSMVPSLEVQEGGGSPFIGVDRGGKAVVCKQPLPFGALQGGSAEQRRTQCHSPSSGASASAHALLPSVSPTATRMTISLCGNWVVANTARSLKPLTSPTMKKWW